MYFLHVTPISRIMLLTKPARCSRTVIFLMIPLELVDISLG